MKIRLISNALICFVFLFACIASAHSQVHEYSGKSKRDPFVPLVTGEARTSLGLETVEGIDDVKLEGIIVGPGSEPIAVLNNEILKEGDKAYNVELLKIEKKSVTIRIHDNVYTIDLVEEGGGDS